MKRILTCLAIVLSAFITAYSQDAEGCKDHPLLTRMPNFIIENCKENFNAVKVPVSTSKVENIEGNVTEIRYVFNEESGQKMPSLLQISKNYENAIIAKGGKKLFSGENADADPLNYVYKASINNKTVWIGVGSPYEPQGNGIGAYTLWIIEVEAMKQDVSASEMLNALNSTGSVSLYINFETGKSDIKPESKPIVQQIIALMKANPSLKISIEGHTDNVGTAASNKTLSDARAKSVMKAVTAGGVEASRMSAKGWGQEKPVADNSSDEGRAKNRRVEIVKA